MTLVLDATDGAPPPRRREPGGIGPFVAAVCACAIVMVSTWREFGIAGVILVLSLLLVSLAR